MHLFLDDIRNPETTEHVRLPIPRNGWTIVRNFESFCITINDYWQKEKQLPEFISFDHDLSTDDILHFQVNPLATIGIEKTGYDCAKWLIAFCMDRNIKPSFDFMVHSMNPVGAKNIRSFLIQAKERL